MTSFAAAIFDFGDTLFHSPSGAEVLVEAGLDRAQANRLWAEIWQASKTEEELAKGRDLSEDRHREAWLRLLERAEAHVPGTAQLLYERVINHDRWLPYPDTAPVLEALHNRGVQVGVLSNIPSPLQRVFEMHGLSRYVNAYTESYRHGRVKPDPELFHLACRQLGVEPEAALMVGDNHLADGAAVLSGIAVLLLPPVAAGSTRGLSCVLRLVC